MKGLPTTKIEIPLAAGRNGGGDPRALEPPALDIATDVQFDEEGGLQLRYPFGSTMTNTFTGGTISNARRIVPNGDELLLFTSDTMYSWNAQLSKWVSKGTHLAVKVDEQTQFATTGDQFDCDRAELNGTIVFAWNDSQSVYCAAIDKTTGSVLLQPTVVVGGDRRPKLVALITKIMLFVVSGDPELYVYALDPASPGTALAGAATTLVASPNFGTYYDAVRVPGNDMAVFACTRTTTTSYSLGVVTEGLIVSTTTKARTADGPVAVSCPSAGLTVQVLRANGTNIQGDYITLASFVDGTTGQAVGTFSGTIYQLTAAHRSVADGGAFRCYAFWSAGEDTTNDPTSDWFTKYNYVDTAGTIGTEATFIRRVGIASRAFDHNGRVYVNLAFALESGAQAGPTTQAQNTYYLYRDDAFLVAKMGVGRSAGYANAKGHLPGVASTGTNTYSWCGVRRRFPQINAIEYSTIYAGRSPHDITLAFDSNEARRAARLGQTLYVSGGEILQYDRVQLTEAGFHVFPTDILLGSTTGSMADGSYTYQMGYRWENAVGDVDRSTCATFETTTLSGGPKGVTVIGVGTYITHKTSSAITCDVWRTEVNPPDDPPFFLVSKKDPTQTSNPNRYLPNVTTAFPLSTMNDELADSSITSREQHPEVGGVLEYLAPPPATIVIASSTRLFLAGVAGDPHRVWYSRLRNDGEVASFHDTLTVEVPPIGGNITALAFLFDTLIVFRETGIYVLRGEGLDNTGAGQNYVAQPISSDVGAVNHESVGLTPMGLLFKSSKGWYLLAINYQVQYVGDKVADYDSETPLGVHVVESQHQARCLTASRMLVWDYLVNQWAEWTVSDGLHAALWQGSYAYLTSTGSKVQGTTYSGVNFGIDIETPWIKPAELQGQSRIRRILALGEYRSAHSLRIRIARDYEYDGAGNPDYFDDVVYTPRYDNRVVGSLEQFQRGPSRQRCQAVKVRITAIQDATQATVNVGTAFSTGPVQLQSPSGSWSAVFEAIPIGTAGNSIQIVGEFELGATKSIEVRDNQVYDTGTGTWISALNTVGLHVVATDNGGADPATAAQLEAAFSHSKLVRLITAHGSPSAQVDMSAMDGQQLIADVGATTAGVDPNTATPPSGEAVKLTGLALLVGVEPGVFRRLTAGQKVGA